MAHVKAQLRHNRIVRWTDGAGRIRSVSLPPDQATAILELAACPRYERGRPPAPTAAVLGALIAARPRITDTTRGNYEEFVRGQIAGTTLGDTDIRTLTLGIAQHWLEERVHTRRAPGPLVHFLRVLMNFPIEAGLLDAAPVDVTKLVAPGRTSKPARPAADESEPLTITDLRRLLDAADPGDAAALHLILCGVEPSEFLVRTCADIDAAIAAGELRATTRRQHRGTALEAHPLGTARWPLTQGAIRALERWRDQRRDAGSWTDDAWAFPGRPATKPMQGNSFAYRLRVTASRARNEAQAHSDDAGARRLTALTVGTLRLTAAVIAGRGGASYFDIATQLHRTVPQIRGGHYRVWLDPVLPR